MKVILRRGYHKVFDSLVTNPPSGINYKLPKFVSSHGQFGFLNELKRNMWRTYSRISKQPNYIRIPNTSNAQLIHSCSGFLVKNEMPWVVDLEHVASFVGFEVGMLEKTKLNIEKILSSNHCKKIMPWTKAAMASIKNGLDTKKFLDKIQVVYPAMEPLNIKKKKHDGINLLFVSIRFFTKGGRELLQAHEMLKKKYDVNLTVVSDVPTNLKKEYNEVNFVEPNVPHDKLLNSFYTNTDIFVLPSYMDTFGMVFLEAMSSKIPIVSTNVFAIPEIIEKSGLVVDATRYSWYGENYLFAWNSWKSFENYVTTKNKPEIVNSIVAKISQLIENSSLRNKIGKNGRAQITKGKFSIKNRNKNLKEIYEEAIKK